MRAKYLMSDIQTVFCLVLFSFSLFPFSQVLRAMRREKGASERASKQASKQASQRGAIQPKGKTRPNQVGL